MQIAKLLMLVVSMFGCKTVGKAGMVWLQNSKASNARFEQDFENHYDAISYVKGLVKKGKCADRIKRYQVEVEYFL